MPYIGAGISRFNTADELTVTGTSEFGGNVSFGDNNITNVGSLQIDSIAGDADTNTNITFAGSDVITMTTAGSERVRVEASGNVKIGTITNAWSGSNTLVIKEDSGDGGITLVSSSTSNNMNIGFADTETSSFADMRGLITYLHASDAMRFMTANTEAVRITSAGLVGISTSSPEGLIGLPATASNTPKFRLQSASTNTDFAISSYADANGTYVSLGANHYLNSSGNDAVFETTDKSAYVVLDARNNGIVAFGTNSSGVAAERMRIDSSGNVLIGKTSEAIGTAGAEFRASGHQLNMTRASGPALNVNRLTDNGDLLGFYQDSSLIGSIGIQASGFYIDGESGHEGMRFANGAITPRENGSDSDGTSDLGASNNRFKDLYLSGGAYLGGTGSANYLDDYEVGTFSPTLDLASNITSAAVDNYDYVKIGNLVHVTFTVSGSVTNASNVVEFRITVPFNGATNNDWHDVGVVSLVTGSGQNQFGMGVITRGGTSFNQVNVYVQGNQVNATGTISTWLRGTLTYRAG
jgi:hypothetical protein